MKFTLSYTNQFKRDYKACKRRNYPLEEIHRVFSFLQAGEKLPAKYKQHKLSGNYSGCWECHIKPDWLLVWETDTQNEIINLVRTGTHTDLF